MAAALLLAVGAIAQPGPGGRTRPPSGPPPWFEPAARRDPPASPRRPACDQINDSLLGAIAGGLLGRSDPRGGGFAPGPMAGRGPGRGCR